MNPNQIPQNCRIFVQLYLKMYTHLKCIELRCCSAAQNAFEATAVLPTPDIILSPLSGKHVSKQLVQTVAAVVAEFAANEIPPISFLSILLQLLV